MATGSRHQSNTIFVSTSENISHDCRLYHLYKTVSEGSSSALHFDLLDMACLVGDFSL